MSGTGAATADASSGDSSARGTVGDGESGPLGTLARMARGNLPLTGLPVWLVLLAGLTALTVGAPSSTGAAPQQRISQLTEQRNGAEGGQRPLSAPA